MNVFRTGILMAAMTAIFLGVGYLIGGTGGMTIAFAVAAVMNFFAYWNSDKMVLSMHKAQAVDDRSAPELVAMVRRLAASANLPMPKVYLIDNPQPNAFATGRNPENAAVAATTGLLATLSRDEVEGVMAHELAHVEHRDTLTMTLTATLAGAVSMLANFAFFFGGRDRNNPLGLIGTLLVMFLAPVAAMLVQMAISRTREYEADRRGAEICGRPLSLANALRRLHQGVKAIPNPAAEQAPATAHLFIVNPLRAGGMDELFATHPRMEERIRRLEAMATGGGAMPPAHPKTARPKAARRATGSSGIPEASGDQRQRGPWG